MAVFEYIPFAKVHESQYLRSREAEKDCGAGALSVAHADERLVR